jgi:hypothetical protein
LDSEPYKIWGLDVRVVTALPMRMRAYSRAPVFGDVEYLDLEVQLVCPAQGQVDRN